MDDATKKMLIDKNNKLMTMVIERVKRDFLDDIALIGLTGSFATNDFHRKSDLDLCIVSNSNKAWKIWENFIFDDVGYSFICVPWENLERKANLERVGVSSLTDLQILYCAKPEYLERFNGLKEKALNLMAKPIDKNSIGRAKKHLDLAKQEYADVMLADELGTVRYASSRVLFNLVNALVSLNNTCIKRGIKRYLEELLTYQYLPDNFLNEYMAVIEAKTISEIKNTSLSLLSGVIRLYDTMCKKFIQKPVPTSDELMGSLEALWGECRNKVIASTDARDKSYAFHAARNAQSAFHDLTENKGTRQLSVMQYFDADNLDLFRNAFLKAMDDYALEYVNVGLQINKYDTFEALYDYSMNPHRS